MNSKKTAFFCISLAYIIAVDLFFTMSPLYLERVLFSDTELGALHCDVAFLSAN